MKVFKLRDRRGFPCVQVATELETTAVDEKWVNFLVFTHNPEDRYDRSYASKLAPELFKRGCADGSVPHVPGEVKRAIVEKIVEDEMEIFPERAREAASLWLQNQESRYSVDADLAEFERFLATWPSHAEARRYLDFGEIPLHLPGFAEVGFDFGPQNTVVSLEGT